MRLHSTFDKNATFHAYVASGQVVSTHLEDGIRVTQDIQQEHYHQSSHSGE